MAQKRGLSDAVSDRRVTQKVPVRSRTKRKTKNMLLKICVSLALGFVGGYAVGRWIRII